MTKRNDIRSRGMRSMGLMRPIGLMGPMRLMRLIGLIGLGLMGCSKEEVTEQVEEEKQVRPSAPVELMSFTKIFMNEDPDALGAPRRTPTSPTWAPGGYLLYEDILDADATLMSNENAAIGVFFTQDSSPEKTVETRKFRYVGGTGAQWRMDEDLEHEGEYYLYGYVPLDAASVSIEPDETTNNYADGARLTFTGLSSVMNKDVCVLVGAKEGNSASSATTYEEVTGVSAGATTVSGYYTYNTTSSEYEVVPGTNTKATEGVTYYRKEDLATGKFDVKINVKENVNDEVHNNLFLLFDHIYSALSFRFKISPTYNQLRDIKLKKLELMAYSNSNFTTPMKKNQSVTITLKATTDGTSPMPSEITFTPVENSGDIGYVLIYENTENPYQLKTTDDNEGMIGFVPRNANFFILRSTYDVYDKSTNLVRKDCVAENRINLPYLFGQNELAFGLRYIIKLFVEPTYLYQLSDPDLDNPTVKVVN